MTKPKPDRLILKIALGVAGGVLILVGLFVILMIWVGSTQPDPAAEQIRQDTEKTRRAFCAIYPNDDQCKTP